MYNTIQVVLDYILGIPTTGMYSTLPGIHTVYVSSSLASLKNHMTKADGMNGARCQSCKEKGCNILVS